MYVLYIVEFPLIFAPKYCAYSTSFRSYDVLPEISARMCYFEKVIKLKRTPQKHIRCFIYFNDNLHELANERASRENSPLSKIKVHQMCEILQASAPSISTQIIYSV